MGSRGKKGGNKTPGDRLAIAGPLPPERAKATRSRVTNGRALFSDNRSTWARRWRDLTILHAEDLGGAAHLSEAQSSLIRRVSTLEVELEVMEGALAEGGEIDLDLYSRITGNLRRVLETLGVERVKRDVTPRSLKDFLVARETAEDVEAAP